MCWGDGLGKPGGAGILLLPGELGTILDLLMKEREQSPERESVWVMERGA